jgi:hypothetical protein
LILLQALQLAEAVNSRPWSQGITSGEDISSLISAAVIWTMTFGVAMMMGMSVF